jgi:hypothetical protein
MNNSSETLRINSERMRLAFDALAQMGATKEGGVDRRALSAAHLAARKMFRKQIVDADLEFRIDGAGNHSAFLACGPKGGAHASARLTS